MPSFNITIDDSSPLIAYSGTWDDSNPGDWALNSYSNHTFHPTQTQGSAASFTFNGTGVYLYGAKRSNHGGYTVSLDGNLTHGNGSSHTGEFFEQLLFSAVNLASGTHGLVLTNTDAPLYLDLDYVIVVGGDGNSSTPQTTTNLEDGMPAFVYGDGWAIANNTQYSGSTAHRTSTPNASAEVHFTGSSISLYGSTDINHGPFSVSLDDAAPLVLNGTAPTLRPQTLLYYFDGIPYGDHIVTVTNLGSGTKSGLDLDYAVVASYTTPGTIPNAASSGSPISTPTSSSSSTPAGLSNGTLHHGISHATLVGLIVGIVLLLALIVLAVILLLRRQRTPRHEKGRESFTSLHAHQPVDGNRTSTGMLSRSDAPPPSYDFSAPPPVPASIHGGPVSVATAVGTSSLPGRKTRGLPPTPPTALLPLLSGDRKTRPGQHSNSPSLSSSPAMP